VSLEDAVLHPKVAAIVWLMMAQGKGYCLGLDHKALVIRTLWDLAQTHIREDLDSGNQSPLSHTQCAEASGKP
jgi:hypothetical protein